MGLGLHAGYPKITSLVVFSTNMVHGIKVQYSVNGNPGPVQKHFNKKEIKKCKKDKLKLDPDEFITYFGGRTGNVIDHISIRTSKGKSIEAGGPGGNPFDFGVPQGYTVGALKGGFGGHIHNIGIVPVPIQYALPPQPYPGYG